MERDKSLPNFDAEIFNFNSHAHVERDVNSVKALGTKDDFNSHAHVERDQF